MPTLIRSPFAITKPPCGSQVDWGHPLARGLVGYWPGNDSPSMQAWDVAGQRTGVFTSVTHVGAQGVRADKVGGPVWHFDGSASLISVASSNVFNSTVGSWSFWFRTTDSTHRMSMLSRNNSGTSNGVLVLCDSFASAGLRLSAGTGITPIPSNLPSADGAWHHALAVWSLANGSTCYLYMDGRLVGSSVNTGAASFNSEAIRAGNNQDAFWSKFNGEITNIAIYNRYLSASEVAWLYAAPFALLRGPDVWRRYWALWVSLGGVTTILRNNVGLAQDTFAPAQPAVQVFGHRRMGGR